MTQYTTKEYWDRRFTSETEYDWLGSYSSYGNILESMLKADDRILVLGELYRSGYVHTTNIDYSGNVIKHMQEKYKDCTEMSWITMDVLNMNFEQGMFDVVIEKAMLDTLLVGEKDPWHISLDALTTTNIILKKVSSILKADGKFISVTWAQPHFRKRLLAKSEYDWSIETKTFGTGLEYFIYIMKKGQQLSDTDAALGLKNNVARLAEITMTLPEDNEDFLNDIMLDITNEDIEV